MGLSRSQISKVLKMMVCSRKLATIQLRTDHLKMMTFYRDGGGSPPVSVSNSCTLGLTLSSRRYLCCVSGLTLVKPDATEIYMSGLTLVKPDISVPNADL